MQTLLGLLANTDCIIWGLLALILGAAIAVVARGTGWFEKALSLLLGWALCLVSVIIGKRLRPPQWEGPGPEPTDIVDPTGPTQDHPERPPRS